MPRSNSSNTATPCSAKCAIVPEGGAGQEMQIVFSQVFQKSRNTPEISFLRAFIEPAIRIIDWMLSCDAMAFIAFGRLTRFSTRKAVLGVRSIGLAAEAT